MHRETWVAVHQPHYFPWIPYMNKLARADVFVLFDTAQLPRGKSKVLRAKYLDHAGEKWLSIPYGKKGELRPIKEVKLDDLSWKRSHMDKLWHAYRKLPHAEWAMDVTRACLLPDESHYLVDIEQNILKTLCRKFGIKTRVVRASELIPYESVSLQEYIVAIVEALDGTVYLTGMNTGSRKTIETDLFDAKGIKLVYQDYEIPRYGQPTSNDFVHTVSIVDTLFTVGEAASNFIQGKEDCRDPS